MAKRFSFTEDGIHNMGGSHFPIALTFNLDEGDYHLIEYWLPRSGSYFESDIRDKFPAHIADDGIDSQKYVL